ncbi:hypothetical protein PF010_g10458 [Phytophthora fragariae]|uniref:Uncharacterized protein n=1 Tax=Phytophthora fragariae TaxID=53985 RepID=A0A6A3RDP2_9STRA|nr:hypothetical protein PF003_g23599 [Phytophthora fragariae]KAE8933128.1 hypothetical protein PF009_g16860 [Phytophthora fragariae]KAE9094742.1 hypothetical protein PF007_g17658 [Phytophthora fragariae]KAE9112407.1 hypothetical protein PF010_g10458 [Phytophthora fragariae]KAE9211126.1 hypothetical protein PF002_g18629 [Phytophthora fragariae]
MDVPDAIHQDVFSKVYDFRETSGESEKQEIVDLEGGGRGEEGTCEQDVMNISTKEEDLVNATVEEKGLVKSKMKAHTRHRPTCR